MCWCILRWLLFKRSTYTFLTEELEKWEKIKHNETHEESIVPCPSSVFHSPYLRPRVFSGYCFSFYLVYVANFLSWGFCSSTGFSGKFSKEERGLLVGRQHEECLKEDEMARFCPAVIFCMLRWYSPSRRGSHRMPAVLSLHIFLPAHL